MLRAKSNEMKLERQTKEWADGKDSLEREVLKLTKNFHAMKKERDKFKRQLARVKGNEGAEHDEEGEEPSRSTLGLRRSLKGTSCLEE